MEGLSAPRMSRSVGLDRGHGGLLCLTVAYLCLTVAYPVAYSVAYSVAYPVAYFVCKGIEEK